MKQKMFLTSCIAMGVVAPAVAAPTNTGEFPTNGLMQEDYTYTNAATETNMDGVYQGSVNATAQYDVIDYILSAGQYLPKDSDVQTTCPAGSFCAGGTFQYDENSDQGLTSCSTATSGIYALSAAGASSQNDCYRTCTTSDVEHSATVTGGYYYGDNNQCGAASCVKGWHLKTTGISGSELSSTIGQINAANSAYIGNDGSFRENSASYGAMYYGLTNKNTWAIDFSNNNNKGMLFGQARCSTRAGANNTWTIGGYGPTYNVKDSNFVSSLTDETGQTGAQYCYCNVTGYKDAGGNLYELSSPWVFYNDVYGNADSCAKGCAFQCMTSGPFRIALLGSATNNALDMCEATDYPVRIGQYLPADSETPTTCPAGYFCAGGNTVQYNETSDQGIQSCPSEYALSVDGASSNTQCYRTCATSDITHSTGVTGNYYYGNNNQCSATGCVNGWHLKTPGMSSSELSSTIGNTDGVNSAYISGEGTFLESNWNDQQETKDRTYYGLTDNNTWAVDYGDKGVLVGQGRCSTQQGYQDTVNRRNSLTFNNPTAFTSLTDETGEDGAVYCYCNVTNYKDASGNWQSGASSWVLHYKYAYAYGSGSGDNCARDCAGGCAGTMRGADSYFLPFRAKLLGTATSSGPTMCEANTITINWSNADAEDISANNAGTATYGSDVRTPVKAETIKGKTFLGWKFSKPEQTPLPE